jgi:DNA-binding GntR family transcriptional regulator
VAQLKPASEGRALATSSSPLSNRSTTVYEQLRRAIIEGTIRPNERLIESELAVRLDVSRTPIRESILRLVGDGLIVSHRRGWVVREHKPWEIREVFEVRAALEGFAAGLAAARATDAELERIHAIHRDHADSIQNSNRSHLVAHNDDFHEAIIAAAGNDLLAQQIHRNSQYYFIHRIAGFLSDDEVRDSIAAHEELVQALVAREVDRAEQVARARVLDHLHKTLAKLA